MAEIVAKKEIVDILKRSDVFLGLSDENLAEIASLPSCGLENYGAGEIIFQEREKAETLYVLVEGRINLTIRLTLDKRVREEVVDVVSKGGAFGWSALVPPYLCTLNAISALASKVLRIKGEEIRQLLDREPYMGYEVMKGLIRVTASRLRDTQQLLASGKRKVTV